MKTLRALAVVCLALLVAHPALAAGAMDRIRTEKKLTVGFGSVRPWTYREADGSLQGIEPDLLKAILSGIAPGVALETVGTEFGGLIPGLQAGRFDISNGGLYITPQRCKLVAFSNPYLRVGDGLLVATGNPHNIHSYKDLVDHPELKVATSRGAINAQNMAEAGIPLSRQLLLPDAPSLLSALKTGRVDAVSLSRGAVAGYMMDPATREGIEVARPFKGVVLPDGTEKRGYAAFAVRSDNKDLVEALNAGLAKAKADGTLLSILKRYSFDETDMPGDATAEALCRE